VGPRSGLEVVKKSEVPTGNRISTSSGGRSSSSSLYKEYDTLNCFLPKIIDAAVPSEFYKTL
jgi:hypothetical protein